MAIPVLLILAALWAAVLLPPFLRARAERGIGVGGARRFGGLGAPRPSALTRPIAAPVRPLGATHPYAVGFARAKAMSPVQRRRRDVLVVLGGAAGFFCLVALVAQSAFTVFLALVALGALGAYCYALVQLKQRRIAAKAAEAEQLERSVKVRYLAHRERTVSAGAMLRRTASSH